MRTGKKERATEEVNLLGIYVKYHSETPLYN
jgi:hypothetical protein